MLDRLRPLELGDERHVGGAGVRHQLPRLPQVGGVCTKLSATMSTPSDRPNLRSSISFAVSAAAGSSTPGRVDALVLAERPPSMTVVVISLPSVAVHAQLDQCRRRAAGDRPGARSARARRTSWRRARSAHEVAGGDASAVSPVVSSNRPAAFEPAGADLGAAEILQNRPPRGRHARPPPGRARSVRRASRACRARN